MIRVTRDEWAGLAAASGVVYAFIAWKDVQPHDRSFFARLAVTAFLVAVYFFKTRNQ